jgi:hypothetical protein
MKSEVEKTAEMLLEGFADNSTEKQLVDGVVASDPFLNLRMDILSFFQSRIETITAQDSMKSSIEAKLMQFVDNDELSFDQLSSLYRMVSSQGNTSVESMLGLFKPTPGVPSILAENIARKDDNKDLFEQLYDKFSTEESDKLAGLGRMMNALAQVSKETKEES